MTSIRKAKKRIKRDLRETNSLIDEYYAKPPTMANLLALQALMGHRRLQLERLNELKQKK